MGPGGYLAARSDAAHYTIERARELVATGAKPAAEAAEVTHILRSFGLAAEERAPIVAALRERPEAWVDFMMRFELGLEKPDPRRALTSALTIGGVYSLRPMGDASPRRAPAVPPCKRRSEHSGALAGDPSAARRPGRHGNAPAELARRACQQHLCLLPPVRASAGEQTPRSLEPPLEPPRHPLAAAGCLDRVELARDPPHRRLENLVGRRRAASPRRRAVVEARQDARVVDHRPPRDRTRSDAVRELPGKAAEETVRVRDGAGDRGRVGAIRDIELGCDELAS